MKSFATFLAALAGLTAVTALPTRFEKKDISSDLLNQLSFYEQYAAAAYCPANNNAGSPTQISCSAGNCPQVQSDGATSVLEFQNQGITDATGFVAVDDTNKLIVISYRGSHSVVNFLSDANIETVPFPQCGGCEVHAGFYSSWLATKIAVQKAVDSAKAAHPDYQIVSTGHSLGAAIATLAAADLRSAGYDVALYTYGSPMVGNSSFAQFVTNQSGGNYRVTHQSDIVTKLPGYWLGYRHVSPEYWITSGDNQPVTSADVQQSSGIQDTSGSYGSGSISVSNHLWYFNAVAGCSSDGLEITK